jgi:hypothetical protein
VLPRLGWHGSNRISNLTMACVPRNTKEGPKAGRGIPARPRCSRVSKRRPGAVSNALAPLISVDGRKASRNRISARQFPPASTNSARRPAEQWEPIEAINLFNIDRPENGADVGGEDRPSKKTDETHPPGRAIGSRASATSSCSEGLRHSQRRSSL